MPENQGFEGETRSQHGKLASQPIQLTACQTLLKALGGDLIGHHSREAQKSSVTPLCR